MEILKKIGLSLAVYFVGAIFWGIAKEFSSLLAYMMIVVMTILWWRIWTNGSQSQKTAD